MSSFANVIYLHKNLLIGAANEYFGFAFALRACKKWVKQMKNGTKNLQSKVPGTVALIIFSI